MKRIGVISTTAIALFLLLGLAVPVYSYQDQQQKPKQEQQAKPEKQQQAKPARQQQARKQQEPAKSNSRQQQAKAKPARQEQQVKSARQEQPKQAERQTEPTKSAKVQQQSKAKPVKQEQQAKSTRREQPKQAKAQRPQRTQQAEARQRSEPALRLSARGNGRIPDARFHSNFGRTHEFHMGNPVLVGGYSRFQYGGYWFGFVQPWPTDWYYTDNVYIDYVDGGYYMYDSYYPGERIAVSVYL